MRSCVVIPARYNSSRFPGKPLIKIAGKTMLERVCLQAKSAISGLDSKVIVATDDDRIVEHASKLGVEVIMTPTACPTGSDRIVSALTKLTCKPDIVVNLQGDAPLTPSTLIRQLIEQISATNYGVITPAVPLNWDALDVLRRSKQLSSTSGTTLIMNKDNEAIWFSKQIIPNIRCEDKLRATSLVSPVLLHLGIYCYKTECLEKFARTKPSHYEQLEQLEQLRFLENGVKIKIIELKDFPLSTWRGVDTQEDATFVEDYIHKNGEVV